MAVTSSTTPEGAIGAPSDEISVEYVLYIFASQVVTERMSQLQQNCEGGHTIAIMS